MRARPQENLWSDLGIADLEREGAIQLGRGKVISKKDLAATRGSYPVYSSAKENDGKFGEYGLYMFDEELITWSVDGGGRLFHRPRHRFSITNVGGFIRILQPERIFCRYLYFVLSYLHSQVVFDWVRKAHPSVIRNVYTAIPLPTLKEQKRIVAVLDQAFADLDRARAHAKANLVDAQELFDAWLTAVFHNYPATWKTTKLKELCDRVTVGHVGPMATRYKSEGITFLRSQNVRPFRISLEDVKFIDEDFHSELRKSELHPGDVAIVRTGYPGTAAVIPDTLTVANCSDLVIARPKSVLSPDFLVMFLNSSFGKSTVAAKAVGSAQKHFNVGAAKEVDFAYPDTNQQNRLVERSKLVRAQSDKLRAVYLTKLADIANVRQSLLQKAFSGELV